MANKDPFDASHAIQASEGFDTKRLRSKSIVITGGASGIGEAAVRAFAKAGAFVTFGDISQDRGSSLAEELGKSVAFVPCDVTNWNDQIRLFRCAVDNSPDQSIDVVFANAGVAIPDGRLDAIDDDGEPTEPDVKGIRINLVAVLYTAKLAKWHFRQSRSGDGCLIMTSSLAGYWDHQGMVPYAATKWGVRGTMRALRQDSGMRVNIIAPWFIRTPIVSEEAWIGIEEMTAPVFAEVEDAATAVLHLACDEEANGKSSEPSMVVLMLMVGIGRSLAVVPRSYVTEGYMDLGARDAWDIENIAQEHHWVVKM
ncbi:hypothetical protein BT93_L1243 [Corymbia citriodora subsp. variegata]|uniref:Uncharacterized protein n=1 Tax=Corymbia citriodora subsp. variegata TaxID=360336 RepID=A0A8T0CEH2_CORYI|nr:hypothetical protein BT93_L1243 [Corymbia citriodora subsp. variegata]